MGKLIFKTHFPTITSPLSLSLKVCSSPKRQCLLHLNREGCNPDTAYNILVDTVGDQLLCSDTNLTPDDTDQLSTCPIEKSELVSGNWSVIIISNNGDGEPIAYERDFTLTVGPQLTSTVYFSLATLLRIS